MDLKNYKIKLGELLENDAAKQVLLEAFPEWSESALLKMAVNMSVAKIMRMAKKKVPQQKLEEVIKKLEEI